MEKTYLFLDREIYSPEKQKGVFGKEVIVNRKNGDEVFFTVKETGKKGYVVCPELFAENTPENRERIAKMFEISDKMKALEEQGNALYEDIERAKFDS